jgi:D-3-phosphoglycerate dehydrogenase / 2-oxoglutarate reductase
MSSFRVAVADSVFPNLEPAKQVLSSIGAQLELAPQASPEGILDVARDADALLVTYAKITAEIIEQLTKCRIISRFGIGVDNVDLDAATKAGIFVTKVPDYCIDEVSDHALALLLSLIRKIPSSSARSHGGTWAMKAVVPIHRVRGQTLGLVGFGRIPQLVTPKAQAFGLNVIAFDPFADDAVLQKCGVRRVDFDELLQQSDHVSIHCPLTPDTRNLFNADTLKRMKRGAYLINTARGNIVDESALADAIAAETLAGAALDVMAQEPPGSSPLFGLENVILTPHTSFYSEESLVELQTKAAAEVVSVLSGREPRNPVNTVAVAQRR